MIIESLLVILLIPLAGTGIADIGDTFVRIFVLICTKLRIESILALIQRCAPQNYHRITIR